MTDAALIKLLADAEKGNDAALHVWLATTPDHEAGKQLHRIAQAALPWKRLVLTHGFVLCLVVLFVAIACYVPWGGEVGVFLLMFTPLLSVLIMACSPSSGTWRLRKGRYAALLLAERGDSRMLPLLLSEWALDPLPMRRAWNDKVAAQITNLLDVDRNPRTTYDDVAKLQNIANSLMAPEATLYSWQLTETQLYLALAVVRHLCRSHSVESIALVKRIAQEPHPAAGPQRRLVSEVARNLLDGETAPVTPIELVADALASPPIPVTVSTTKDLPTTPAAQIIRRL